jgi:hypothetical protein
MAEVDHMHRAAIFFKVVYQSVAVAVFVQWMELTHPVPQPMSATLIFSPVVGILGWIR